MAYRPPQWLTVHRNGLPSTATASAIRTKPAYAGYKS